jgi:tetratricopeptide (TPR) repeat protein
MRRPIATTLLLALAAATAPAAADIVHLKDGHTVEGKIKRADAYEWVVYAPDRRATFVRAEDVASFELTARPLTDPVAAAGRLDALRRSVAHVDDPAKAVERYRRFIDAGADPLTLRNARQDLALWQDRADRHLARLGDRWVDPAAREQAVAAALSDAAQARQLLKQGRFAQAEPLVNASLAIDPQNVTALYLQGLLRLQQNQLPGARQAFEAVAAAVPDHGPTLVNLAVIAWQQRRFSAALERYDQAMVAAPADPLVLADVAAALADLPDFGVATTVIDRVATRYQAQRKQLAAAMAQRGLHPFGAAWLTDDQFADVRRAQQQDQATLNSLAGDFERAQDQVRQTDLSIATVVEQMHRSAVVAGLPGPWLASYDGGDGPVVPTVYGQLRNDADQLQKRRAVQVARLDAIQRQAVAIRRRMNGEAPTGPVQRPVGPEGTPLAVPPRP